MLLLLKFGIGDQQEWNKLVDGDDDEAFTLELPQTDAELFVSLRIGGSKHPTAIMVLPN